jgi:hypothetical protein
MDLDPPYAHVGFYGGEDQISSKREWLACQSDGSML